MIKIIRYVATNDRGVRLGQYHQNAKLTDQQVDQIRQLHEEGGLSYRQISRLLGVALGTVRCLCAYKRRCTTYEIWRKVETE